MQERESDRDIDNEAKVVLENNLEAIIDQLMGEGHGLPVEAIRAARKNQHDIIPHLIKLIEEATESRRQGLDVEQSGHFYATYLLAEFQATEAWPAIVAAVSLPGDDPFELYGDAITEDLASILAALVGDRLAELNSIIEAQEINVYVRWQAIDAMMLLIKDGKLTRESAVEQMTRHLARELESDRDSAVLHGLIVRLCDLGAQSSLPLIETVLTLLRQLERRSVTKFPRSGGTKNARAGAARNTKSVPEAHDHRCSIMFSRWPGLREVRASRSGGSAI